MAIHRQMLMLVALITATWALAQDTYTPPEGGGQWSFVTVLLRGTALDTLTPPARP